MQILRVHARGLLLHPLQCREALLRLPEQIRERTRGLRRRNRTRLLRRRVRHIPDLSRVRLAGPVSARRCRSARLRPHNRRARLRFRRLAPVVRSANRHHHAPRGFLVLRRGYVRVVPPRQAARAALRGQRGNRARQIRDAVPRAVRRVHGDRAMRKCAQNFPDQRRQARPRTHLDERPNARRIHRLNFADELDGSRELVRQQVARGLGVRRIDARRRVGVHRHA